MEELKGIVHSDPEIMGGTPVFVGTRVPLQNLIDALEGGESVEDFLEGFPSVKRSQAIAVIEAGQLKMLETVGYECAGIGICRVSEQWASVDRAVTSF
jgi:uncharacterized protein (DUF433 family)